MNTLFAEFPKASKTEWEEQLKKELKGADFNAAFLQSDSIEELVFSSYVHQEDRKKSIEIPDEFPFLRGVKSKSNDWKIAATVQVSEEKEANQDALRLLMSGCDALIFDLKIEHLNCSLLFAEIGFEFIQTQLIIRSASQLSVILEYFNEKQIGELLLQFKVNEKEEEQILIKHAQQLAQKGIRFCHINAFGLQQCGATIVQELAYALSQGHEHFLKLISSGLGIEQASQSIHFSLGIGSNYFFEIAKFRAFRFLWSKMLSNYKPQHLECTKAFVTAETGFINKSLKDPYTNLLRQTTEAMSAVASGVETLLVRPFDEQTVEGSDILAARMALNISLILKEESYFDQVIDPIGGSYSIEQLTEQIAMKSWQLFQELDEKGGLLIPAVIDYLRQEVQKKAAQKLHLIEEGKQLLIGVNKFPNAKIEARSWLEPCLFMEMKNLVFERDLIK